MAYGLEQQLLIQKKREAAAAAKQSTKAFETSVSTSKRTSNQQRYLKILQDMEDDPEKYYTAFNGSVTKYNSQQNYLEYMATLSNYDLPSTYTKYAYLYDDMTSQKDKYIQALGSESAYKNQLSQVKELYGIERDNAEPVLSLISDKVSESFLTESGLDQFYSYDETSADDMMLQELGYAPTSFDYTISDLSELQNSGYKASNFFTTDDDGNYTDQAKYLSTLYSYDESDPEDILNAALGLMPKSFEYDKTDEDVIRKSNGELPLSAEEYVKNSEQFATDYQEYAAAEQEYADELYAYNNLNWVEKIFTKKPTDPYKDETTVPATVQDVMTYKNMLSEAQLKEQTYNTDTPELESVEAPNFYFGDIDDLSLYTDKKDVANGTVGYFQPSDQAKAYQTYVKEAEARGLVDSFVAQNKTNYVETKMDEYYVQKLKESGQYEEAVSQSEELQQQLTKALSGGYTPENLAVLLENQDATEALIGKNFEWKGLVEYGTAGLNNEIKDKLKALGWKGETESDNPQIQALLNEAAYNILSAEYNYTKVTTENMMKNPSWLNAIWTGMDSGVSNVKESILTVSLKGAQLMAVGGNKELIGEFAMGVAENSQLRQNKNLEYIEAGKGGSTTGTEMLYNIASTSTELAIEIALGNAIGSIGTGASAAASAETASTLSKLASKALFSKQLVPYFVASLGSNLMEGELEGRTDLQNWTVSLLTAYMESKTEGMTGFFSKGSSAYSLFKNGLKNLSGTTLKNIGKTLLENTLGETVEELVQDVLGNVIEQTITGQSDEMSFSSILNTITTTMGVGVLLSLFGIPSAFKSYSSSVKVQTAFNEMVDAYESGDTAVYNTAVEKMKAALPEALSNLQADYMDGSLDRAVELMEIDSNLAANLDEMNAGIRQSLQLRQARENGQDVSQASIDFADARANSAISTLRTQQGVTTTPATLYDQVANSTELTAMVNKDGLSSSLIRNNGGKKLTNSQVAVLQEVEQAAEANPYVDMTYTENDTEESIQKRVDDQKQDLKVAQAKYNQAQRNLKKQLDEAYAVSEENGKRVLKELTTKELVAEQQALRQKANKEKSKLADIKSMQDGYKAQQQYRTAFAEAATVTQEAQTATIGQTVEGTENTSETTGAQAEEQAQQEQTANAQREAVLQQEIESEFERTAPVLNDEQADVRRKKQKNTAVKKTMQLYRHAHENQADIAKYEKQLNELESKLEGLTDEEKAEAQKKVDSTRAELQKIKDKQQASVEKLMNALNLTSIVERLKTTYPTGFDRTQAMEQAGDTLNTYSQTKAGERFNTQSPMYILRALDNALSIIADGEAKIAAYTPEAISGVTSLEKNARKNVVSSIEEPGTKTSHKEYTIINATLGLGAESTDQVSLDLDGNNEDGPFTRLLYNEGSTAFERLMRYYVGLKRYSKEFFDNYSNKFLKIYEERGTYSYELSSGKKVNLTGKEIMMIANNLRGGNNIMDGIVLGTKQEMHKGEYTRGELEDIASVIYGEQQSDQAKAIAEKMGSDLQSHKDIAEFVFNLNNIDSYTDVYGDTMPAPRTLLDIASTSTFGIKRTVGENYFIRTHLDTFKGVRRAVMDSGEIPTRGIEHARTNDTGMVYFPTLNTLIDRHCYETSHAAAYDAYLQKMDLVLRGIAVQDENGNTTTVIEKMRTTFGEKYVNRVKAYLDDIVQARTNQSDIGKMWEKLYSGARARRLISPTVWVKQLGSVFHAAAYLDAKYLWNPSNWKAMTAEQKKAKYQYAASLVARIEGRGAIRETTEIAAKKGSVTGLMKPILFMDTRAVNFIFKGVWNQVKAENPGLTGEAFYQKVGETARYVIEKTQPTYAPHTVSAVSQEKGFITKAFTMYSTATNSMYNTIVGSVRDFKTGNTKRAVRKLMSVLASCAATWGMGKAVEALWGASDWEDESTFGKVVDIASAYTGMFYGIRTIVSSAQYGNFNIPVVEEFTDMITAMVGDAGIKYGVEGGMFKYISDARNAETEEDRDKATRKALGSFKKFATALASLKGVPVSSAEKWLVKPILRIIGGQELLTKYDNLWGYNLNASAQYENLNKAITKGNDNLTRQYIKIIINKGGSLENFLKAKTGGESLSMQQQYELTQTWKDVQLEMSLDTVAGGDDVETSAQSTNTTSGSNYGKGNIDLNNRPIYHNSDGSISTVDSISFSDDTGKEILIPTIRFDDNGNAVKMTDDEAIDWYYETGEYLGKFDTIEEADTYAERLHEDQASLYGG